MTPEKGQAALLYEQATEKKLGPFELRNYVIETIAMILNESNEAMEMVSPSYKQRKTNKNARTSIHRFILMILLILSMVLDVIGMVIMASVSVEFLYNYQLISIFAALVATILSLVMVSKRGAIEIFALLVIFGLLFESPMLTLFKNGDVILILGVAAVCVRLLILLLTSLTMYRQFKTESRERLYLKFMDSSWSRDITRLVTKIIDTSGIEPNKLTYSEAPPKVVTAITKVMEESYNSAQEEGGHHSQCDPVDVISVLDANDMQREQDVDKVGNRGWIPNRMSDTSCHMHSLLLSSVRNAVQQDDIRMTKIILFILFFVICATTGNVAFEFWKIFANQTPNYSDDLNEKYNNRERIRAEFGGGRSHTDLKVHVLVVDGLRDDFTDAGVSAIGEYMDTAAFKRSSMKFHSRAQLPSFSVPNWMSLLTGAFPEDTGVTGNLWNAETTFDNIYSIAKEFDVHAGITGTPWWASLVASTLPPLGGDGTIDAGYRPKGTPDYGWTTSDPADGVRKEVALTAARRNRVIDPFGTADNVTNFYELFLTHFSDVDAQGHAYGIDIKFNKRDTYRSAVTNKTKAIQEIVDAIDDKTILIITSDHGHVMRGGHGGADDILRDIPLVFYKKGAIVAKPIAKYFKGNEEPLKRFNKKYSNLDLSATICAILGLPSPRQSMGVFVEEVVEAFVPASVQLRHYHDLFVAKVRAVQQYHEMMQDTFFPGMTPDVLGDIDPIVDEVLNGDGSYDHINSRAVTKADYVKLIKRVIPEYYKMRHVRNNGILIRNFVISFIVCVPIIVVIGFIYHTAAFLRISALTNREHPLHSINLITLLCAILTLLLYLLFSIVTYVVIYYVILGQTLWDSTATHTPSVALQYLVAVIVGPIVYFTLFTKVLLLHTIRWRVCDAITELRSLKKIQPTHIVKWISVHLIADIQSLVFATRNYKPHKYIWAHLYIRYLSGWTILSSLVMLFMCFPFSFIVPGIFSVSHVSEGILVYRFRLISVLFIMLPMQCGCMLMVFLRPHVTAENRTLWDIITVKSRFVADLYCIESRKKEVMKRNERIASGEYKGDDTVSDSEEILETLKINERKIHALVEWLGDPKYTPHICDTNQRGAEMLFFSCGTEGASSREGK